MSKPKRQKKPARGGQKGNRNAAKDGTRVKLTCQISEATRQALGPKPGAFLDAHFGVLAAEVSQPEGEKKQ